MMHRALILRILWDWILRCNIRRSCVNEISISVPDWLQIFHFLCFIFKQAPPSINTRRSPGRCWNNSWLTFNIIYVNYLLMSSNSPLLTRVFWYFFNVLSIYHWLMLTPVQVSVHRRREEHPNYEPLRKRLASKSASLHAKIEQTTFHSSPQMSYIP